MYAYLPLAVPLVWSAPGPLPGCDEQKTIQKYNQIICVTENVTKLEEEDVQAVLNSFSIMKKYHDE